MKFLYDEEAGRQERQAWTENGPSLLKKKDINNALFKSVSIAVFMFYICLLLWVSKKIPAFDYTCSFDSWKDIFSNAAFVPLLIHIAGAAALAFGTMRVVAFVTPFDLMNYPKWPYLSANAVYTKWLAEGRKVLECRIKSSGYNYYVIEVVLEDAKNIVTTRTLWEYEMEKSVRTDIKEATVDLLKNRIYEPYRKT